MTNLAESPRLTAADVRHKLAWSYSDLELLTGISYRELQRMVHRGELPAPKRRGKLALFMPGDVRLALKNLPEERQ